MLAATGCRQPSVNFPREPASLNEPAGWNAYDTNKAGKADFFTAANADGRIDRIGYDITGDGKIDQIIPMDDIRLSHCRHLVIILDGFGYEVIEQYRAQGGLAMFYPPSRVIAPYPTLTDPSLEDLLGYVPAKGFEAEYFDHTKNRTVGGSASYLAGMNQPYDRFFEYRANLIFDAIGYVYPKKIYTKEINDTKEHFDKRNSQEMIAYLVSSAGMGTIYGTEGQLAALRQVDQLVNQVIYETHGLTKITLLADHGHSYTPGTRINLEKFLKDKGWRLSEKLSSPKDVVYIRFGLETYASFDTLRPADLAADLATAEGVDLASYADGQSVVVLDSKGGRAVIDRRGDAYRYTPSSGDPLAMADAIASLPKDADGFIDRDVLFDATATQEYPAAMERLWRAHFTLVDDPADVIVSLKNNYYSGSRNLNIWVKVASTHGSLNRQNSTTFIMSTAGKLPPILRSRDVPAAMKELFGVPEWPMRK